MIESDRFVVLLGAGFSAPANLPVMAEFAQTARRLYFDHKRASAPPKELIACYEGMFAFQHECERSGGALLRDWENIEELYTQADLRRLTNTPTPAAATTLCDQIAWVIWDVYRHGIKLPGTTSYSDILAKYLDRLLKKQHLRPVVVTTNYDLVLDSALSRGGVPFHYPGFEFMSPSAAGGLLLVREGDAYQGDPVTSVEVVKLHGSVNWLVVGDRWYCSKRVVNSETDHSVVSGSTTHEDVIRCALQADASVSATQVRPALIPPMLGKIALKSVIARQWRSAIDAFMRARTVLVIGYSFPETDAFMTRLLAEGLHNNDDLDQFIIADLQSVDAWRGKLVRMFGPHFLRKHLWFASLASPKTVNLLGDTNVAGLLKECVRVE